MNFVRHLSNSAHTSELFRKLELYLSYNLNLRHHSEGGETNQLSGTAIKDYSHMQNKEIVVE
jgi:hypothetical protein